MCGASTFENKVKLIFHPAHENPHKHRDCRDFLLFIAKTRLQNRRYRRFEREAPLEDAI